MDDLNDWEVLKGGATCAFSNGDYASASSLYESAFKILLMQLDQSMEVVTEENRNGGCTHQSATTASRIALEVAKIGTNISLAQYKLGNLSQSLYYAATSAKLFPAWVKSYLRLIQAYMDMGDQVNAIIEVGRYLSYCNAEEKQSSCILSYMRQLRYFTHMDVIKASPNWHLIKYPDNVYVLDSHGAGHFKDLSEIKSLEPVTEFSEKYVCRYVEGVSLLVRPGTYTGIHAFECCQINIVGDCDVAAGDDKKLSAVFKNYPHATPFYRNLKSTFSFVASKISLCNLDIQDLYPELEASNAVFSSRSTLEMTSCSFSSTTSPSLLITKGSILHCVLCRSVDSQGGVLIRHKDSTAEFENCHFEACGGLAAIAAADRDVKSLTVKSSTFVNCHKAAIISYSYTKVSHCSIDNKDRDKFYEHSSIDLTGNSKFSVTDTNINNRNGFAAVCISHGRGKICNVTIQDSKVGIMAGGHTLIKDCVITECPDTAIVCTTCDADKDIQLQDNIIEKCGIEVSCVDGFPKPHFVGNCRHQLRVYPKENLLDGALADREMMKKQKKKIKQLKEAGSMPEEVDLKLSDGVCDFCCAQETHLEKKFSWCGGCKLVKYCSRRCQASGWKSHKTFCEMIRDRRGK